MGNFGTPRCAKICLDTHVLFVSTLADNVAEANFCVFLVKIFRFRLIQIRLSEMLNFLIKLARRKMLPFSL